MNTSDVRGLNLCQKRAENAIHLLLLFLKLLFLFYFVILLSVIIAEASEITEKQSGFSGKIIDGDG